MKLFSLFIFSFLLCASTASAQKYFTFNQGHISQEEFYQVIPFEYIMNKIIVEAEINGVKGRYVLDTGAMCIVFKDSTKQQNYKTLRKMPIVDANGITNEAEVVEINQIRLGELEYSNIPALHMEAHELFKCFDLDGFIGSNLLRFGAFKVDVQAKELLLADSYKAFGLTKKEGEKLWLNKVQNSPFIRIQLNGLYQHGVLVDTGSDCLYAFNNMVAEKMKKKGLFNQPAFQSSGTNSQGAWGLDSIEIKSDLWRVNQVKVAGAEFNNLLLRSDEASSRIGMELLEKGDFVLDYPKQRFFFKPYQAVNDSLSMAGFGIDFTSVNDSIRVNGLWSGTLAENQGIVKGDILMDITGFNLREADLCDKFFLLKELGEDKNELEFIFRKQDSEEEYLITLQRIK